MLLAQPDRGLQCTYRCTSRGRVGEVTGTDREQDRPRARVRPRGETGQPYGPDFAF